MWLFPNMACKYTLVLVQYNFTLTYIWFFSNMACKYTCFGGHGEIRGLNYGSAARTDIDSLHWNSDSLCYLQENTIIYINISDSLSKMAWKNTCVLVFGGDGEIRWQRY